MPLQSSTGLFSRKFPLDLINVRCKVTTPISVYQFFLFLLYRKGKKQARTILLI